MTPPLLRALAQYAFQSDRDLEDVNGATARAYHVAVTLLAEPVLADDEASFIDMAGAHLWYRRTETPRDVDQTALAARLAFLFRLAYAYHLLRG